jgi:hypothetical protein
LKDNDIVIRAYFASHAPEAPDWFKYQPPTNKPLMPPMPNFTPEQKEKFEQFVCHDTCRDWEVSQYVRQREQAKAAQDGWRDACRERKFFAWRWYYADQMMASMGEQV